MMADEIQRITDEATAILRAQGIIPTQPPVNGNGHTLGHEHPTREPGDDWAPPGQQPPEPDEPLEPVRPFTRLHIDLRNPPAPPVMLHRLIYAGLLTVIQSEPGVGKSWIAGWQAWQALAAGYSVVYMDEEGGPDLITERMIALGADPDVVDLRFHYFAFEARSWGEDDLLALDQVITDAQTSGPLALGVLDSLPDFLAAAALDEDRARDVTTFVLKVCSRFRAAAAACLLLDHLKKPEPGAKQSRYSRGSGAKLAKADATLLLEEGSHFDVNTSGQLRVWKTKDRRGRLDLPTLGHEPYLLNVIVTGGAVRFEETSQPIANRAEHTYSAAQQAVIDVLRNQPGVEFSRNRMLDELKAANKGFKVATIGAAIALLRGAGAITVREGARGAQLMSWLPGGAVTPTAVPWLGLDEGYEPDKDDDPEDPRF